MLIFSQCVHVHIFFFNAPATTEIYTLSLHDALPIYQVTRPLTALLSGRFGRAGAGGGRSLAGVPAVDAPEGDRKSTRLNSSHVEISYAVFCLKKKTSEVRLRRHSRLPTRARSSAWRR